MSVAWLGDYLAARPSLYLLSLLLIFVSFYTLFTYRHRNPDGAPLLVTRFHKPVVGALKFFQTRWDFFEQSKALCNSAAFSFFIGKHHVVALTGDTNRAAYFESKDLDSGAGYAVLFGQGTSVSRGGGTNFGSVFGQYFVDRIGELMHRDNLVRALPDMMSDARRLVDQLARNGPGVTDPFDSLYNLIFRLTMRVVGSKDIADDDAMLAKTMASYQVLEDQSTDALAIAVSWLPTPSRLRLLYHGAKIHKMLSKLAADRKRTEKRVDDALQALVDRGDSEFMITAFLLSAIFAGQANTGAAIGYLLLHLARQPVWLAAVRAELRAALHDHAPSAAAAAESATPPHSLPLLDRLAALPLAAWESAMPTLDAALRETIRVHLMASGFRANLSGAPIPLPDGSGASIPPGSFATSHFGEPHRDPRVWPEPLRWDPERFLRGDDEKAGKYAFVGWGAGRHPCLGKRTAKVEVCIGVAFFVAAFDFETVDGKDVPSGRADSAGIMRPLKSERVLLRYWPRVGEL